MCRVRPVQPPVLLVTALKSTVVSTNAAWTPEKTVAPAAPAGVQSGASCWRPPGEDRGDRDEQVVGAVDRQGQRAASRAHSASGGRMRGASWSSRRDGDLTRREAASR